MCLIERKNLIENISAAVIRRKHWPGLWVACFPRELFGRNTAHTYVSTSCLLRGFVFFGTECTDLQRFTNLWNSTLCNINNNNKKSVYLYFSRYATDILQNLHCFYAWVCVLEAHPRRSYKLSIAFFPHHWFKRNKTYSVWKPPHQTEIPHASVCIYLHMNHLVFSKAFLVSGIRFAYLHFTWGLRQWKAICRAESTQLFPMIQLYL